MQYGIPQQLSLFHRDEASELARACLDLAWDMIQHRKVLTLQIAADLFADLAIVRERLAALTAPPAPLIRSPREPQRCTSSPPIKARRAC